MTALAGYMVDTNVFDGILDGTIAISAIDGPLYSTSIQRDELEAIPNEERRASLLKCFHASTKLNTPVTVWGVSSWDEANFGTAEQNQFVEMFAGELRAADHVSKKRPKDPLKNSMGDALIALTAREHGMVLITRDKNLEALAARHGIRTQCNNSIDFR
jgi:predicted nucleic acid-binding protein